MLLELEETEAILDEIAIAGTKPFVVVGIPAFNEATMIADIVLETQKHADAIVVCDGHTGRTLRPKLQRLEGDPRAANRRAPELVAPRWIQPAEPMHQTPYLSISRNSVPRLSGKVQERYSGPGSPRSIPSAEY